MQRYTNFIASTTATNSTLTVLSNASCVVYIAGTLGAATLYSDNGVTPLANPFLSSATGEVSFFAADGSYDLVVSQTGYLTVSVYDILLATPSGGGGGGFLIGAGAPTSVELQGTAYSDSSATTPDARLWFNYNGATGWAKANTTAYGGIAIGTDALLNSGSSSSSNIAIGYEALKANVFGSGNVAVGTSSMASIEGSYNVGIGHQSIINGTSGNYNVAVGQLALMSLASGSSNIGIGSHAVWACEDGQGNIGLGDYALSSIVSSGNCVAIGQGALTACTADDNIGIGYQAGYINTTGTNNIFLGSNSQNTTGGDTASNTIVLGNSSTATLRCNTATISALSDKRDKKDIEELPIALDFVLGLNPVEFVWAQRGGGREGLRDTGFIAQEVLSLVTSHNVEWMGIVDTANPDRYEMSPGKLIPVLVAAIQELNFKLDTLLSK